MSKLTRYSLLLAAVTAFLFTQKAAAQTTWIGPANGLWSAAANWSNGLPASGNAATIPGGASVSINAALTVGFGVDNFGSIAVTAALTNASGGNFSNSGSMTFSGSGSLTNAATFSNFGSATFQAAATLTNQAGASLTNGGTLTIETALNSLGGVINNGTISAPAGTILASGSTFDNRQQLTTKTLTVAAGTTYINTFGATTTVTGTGAALTVNATGQFNNFGTVNVGTAAFNIAGAFANSVTLNLNAGTTTTVAAGGSLTNSGTVTNKAAFINNGSVTNSNSFFNEGTLTNNSGWANNNTLENRLCSTFTNAAGSSFLGNFGSVINNIGTFNSNASLNTPGQLTNSGTWTNTQTVVMQSGSTFSNSGTFNNNGTLQTQNAATNTGTLNNLGTLEVQSGSVFNNSATLKNNPGGRVIILFELKNLAGGTFTNNGTVENRVRFFANAGTTTNNGYWLNTGDAFVAAGATLANAGIFNQNEGNVQNKGSLTNAGTFLNDDCSSVSNTSTVSTTGSFQNRGLVFQRGTVTGTITNAAGSFTHTGATSASTAICKNNFAPSADATGTIKVYSSALVVPANVDSCQNIIYRANGVARPTFTCATVGTTVNVNFVMTTRLGDSLNCVSPVQMTDKLAPDFTGCPSDVKIFTPNATAPATWTAPTASDNCSASPTLTSNFSPGATFPVGITGVTYTATDGSANTQQCQFRVIVVRTNGTTNCAGDATPPTILGCPANISKTTEFSTEKITWQEPTATDACSPISLSSNIRPGADFPVGTTTVIYTARDGNNNPSTCSFTVTLTKTDLCPADVSKPYFSNCPTNLFLTTNANLNGAVGFWTPPSAGDNCAITSITSTHQPGQIFPVGATTVVYTATDAKNNTATCAFTITVGATAPCPADVTGPTFTGCPSNINLTTSGIGAAATWAAPTATDPCGGVTISASHAPGTFFPIGVTAVAYTASDAKGNRSTCSFLVTVTNPCFSDATPPTFSGCPANIFVAATSANGATATWTPPTATDACGAVSVQASYQPGALFPLGATTVNYSAIDARGNVANCSFIVNVVQVPTCPALSSPINNATGVATASVALTWNSVLGAQTYDVYLGNANPPAAAVATNLTATSFTATSLTAGTAYYWFIVAKNVAGASQNCTATNKFTTTGTAPAGCSNISASGTIAADETNCGVPFNPANITSTTLPSGGSTNALQYQWVSFTSDPWANPGTGTVISGATAATYDPPNISTTTFYQRRARRQGCTTYGGSNFVKKAAIAATAPVANCKPLSVTLVGGTASITAAQVDNGSTAGACGTITNRTLSQSTFTTGGVFPTTLTVTNSAGLSSTCTAQITVVAPCTQPPTAVCKNASKTLSGGTATIAVADIDNGSTPPACGGTITGITLSQTTFTAAGTFPVTMTVTASNGQTATCTAQVTISNATDPCTNVTITPGPSSITVGGLSAAPIQIVQVFNSSWSQVFNCAGNCQVPTLTVPSLPVGTYFVRVDMLNSSWTALCKKELTVSVSGGTTPVLTLNSVPNMSATAATGQTTAVVNFTPPTASSTCTTGSVSVTQTAGLASGAAFPIGVTTNVFQATDGCGNVKTTSFTVTVSSATPTVLTLNPVANITVTAASGATSAVVTFAAPTASTTCTTGSITIAQTGGPASGSAFPLGATTVTYQATDGCFNAKTTSFTITVNAATGGDPCAGVTVTPGANNITLGGLNGSPIALVQVFNSGWAQVFNCSGNCAVPTQVVPSLPAGLYHVKVDMLNAAWTPICTKNVDVTVTGGGGPTGVLTFNTPADISVTAATGQTSAVVTYPTPPASTTCMTGSLTVVRTAGLASGSAFPIGTTVVSHSATDGCGNVKIVSFDVVVAPPAGGGPSCATVAATAGAGSITVSNVVAPVTGVQIFRLPAWTPVYSCTGNCTTPNVTVSGLIPASYIVRVDLYTANWSPICQKDITVTVASALVSNPNDGLVFGAWKRDFDVELKWISRGGATDDFFVLERSLDGIEFKPLRALDAKGPAGENLYFHEIDEEPLRGENFYRLKTLRLDGSAVFSETKKVVFGNRPFTVFPNPASEKASIDLPDWAGKAVDVELFDQMGRPMRRFSFANLPQDGAQIDLDELPDGVFIVRVTSEGELARTLRLVKETR